MSRYEVTTVYKDGSKQQNHYNTQDCAIRIFLLGVNYPDIVKSVWVYDSVKQSIILDSRQSGKVAIPKLEDL